MSFSVITVTGLYNQLRNGENNQRDDETPSLSISRKCLSVFCDRWIHIMNIFSLMSELDFSRAEG